MSGPHRIAGDEGTVIVVGSSQPSNPILVPHRLAMIMATAASARIGFGDQPGLLNLGPSGLFVLVEGLPFFFLFDAPLIN